MQTRSLSPLYSSIPSLQQYSVTRQVQSQNSVLWHAGLVASSPFGRER